MGCPADVELGDNLVFSVCTHDPDTGALTDATGSPTYRVYEDETATAITSGTLSKLDDASTTGFYTELLACTTLAGYEAGKTYTIYVEAVVDGVTGGISFGFKVKSPSGVKKNTELADFEFLMVLATDHITPATGKTIVAERSIGGAAFAVCANSVSEVSNGIYKITLAAADLNGSVITFKFDEVSCDTRYITIKTVT